MWCRTGPGIVVHQIRDDKGAATLKDLMAGHHGTIVCDALKTHEVSARRNDGIVLAGSWGRLSAPCIRDPLKVLVAEDSRTSRRTGSGDSQLAAGRPQAHRNMRAIDHFVNLRDSFRRGLVTEMNVPHPVAVENQIRFALDLVPID